MCAGVRMKLLISLVCLYLIRTSSSGTSTAIPSGLLHCYSSDAAARMPKPPLTTKLLVELIRKLEHDKGEPHIRPLTNSILHTAKFDGVQRGSSVVDPQLVPFRALGKSFFKYRFLVDHLTPGDSLRFPRDAITDAELCMLHFILSNSYEPWLRGDEAVTCDTPKLMPYRDTSKPRSACPVEKGVIKSRWGTISAGHLVAGVASALQGETVELGRILDDSGARNNLSAASRAHRVSNVWVSTVVGDLAEVLIDQGVADARVGAMGSWNDTLLPRDYYLTGNYWDMTAAELLGGVDGIVLASRAKEWVASFEKIRFSQLIDMYYSGRGIAFDSAYGACKRREKWTQLLNGIDLAEQVSGAAKILQTLGSYGPYIPEETIDAISEAVAETYRRTAGALISNYDACQLGALGPSSGRLEIITITDDTWGRYQTETFLAYFSEVLDVSFYGSKIGLINGQTGVWMTNITGDLVQLHGDLSTAKDWPTTLALTASLHSAIFHYQNKTESACSSPFQRPYGKVVLVLAQSTYLTDNEVRTATASVASLVSAYPETRIVLVATGENARTFEALAETARRNVIVLKSNKPDIDTTVREISKELSRLPASVIDFYCNNGTAEFEDYITPGVTVYYEIREEYVRRAAHINIKFKGNGYGDLSVCAYNGKTMLDKSCKGVTVHSEVTFNIKDHCDGDACTVQFAVSADNSGFKCAEYDCRYPDQLRLNILTSWSSGSNRLLGNCLVVVVISMYYFIAR